MSNMVSIQFLRLNQKEQHNILNNLSRDFRRRELFSHFLGLYNLKKRAITNQLKTQQQQQSQQQQPQQQQQQPQQQQPQKHPYQKPQQQPQQQQPQQHPYQKPQQQPQQQQQQQHPYQKPHQQPLQQRQQSPPQQKPYINSKNTQNNIDSYNQQQERAKTDQYKHSVSHIKTAPVKSEITIDIFGNNQNIANKIDEVRENLKKIKKNTELVEKIDYSTFIDKFMVQNKLKSLIENKKVALIGPANYLININQGDYINNQEIVIRFNSGILQNNEYITNVGNRTDIWIYNFKNLSILDKLTSFPKLIFCPYPKSMIDRFNINNRLPNCNIEFIEPEFYDQLKLVMKFEPNSALLTILILLRQNIKSLYISGISFLYDGYYDTKNNSSHSSNSNSLITNVQNRSDCISILKKIYNANERVTLDNTMLNIIFPNFITVLNKLFSIENHNKLFSTLDYRLFVPSFQSKHNNSKNDSKIYVHFGKKEIMKMNENMDLIVHMIRPNLYNNEVYIQNEQCNYDDLETLLGIKNKGIVYFSNNQWIAIDNMMPKKNREYILSHHCYVNGNIYGSFIKYIVIDFDINENNENLNMLYLLFSLIYYGQKMVYLQKENVKENGLIEICSVMNKLNLIKYI